jgi:hypothetical protein
MVKQQEHQPINDEYHLFIKKSISHSKYSFLYLERISFVGNDVEEPHFVSDHVVQSPTINPVSMVTNNPMASVLNPTFHKAESPIHKPKTIPNIGPYQIKTLCVGKTFLTNFHYLTINGDTNMEATSILKENFLS